MQKIGDDIDLNELQDEFELYDVAKSGSIKVFHLVNVIRFQLPDVFKKEELNGLQVQLDLLSRNQEVDYSKFIEIFFSSSSKDKSKQKETVD